MITPMTRLVCLCLILGAGGHLAAQVVEFHGFTNVSRLIPDGDLAGLSDTRSITSAVTSLASLRVWLRVEGEFNGDLYAYVRHIGSGRTNLCVLLNRPGRSPGNTSGYADAGLDVVFDDTALAGDPHLYGAVAPPAAGAPWTGVWQPDGRAVDPTVVTDATARTTTLGAFAGMNPSGEWTLYILDAESGGSNQVHSWGVEVGGAAAAPVWWAAPADIVYGTPLGGAQLNATSSVPGTYAYAPPAGTVLNAGPGQVLSVTFSPQDTAQYAAVTTNVGLNVLPKSLLITANSNSKVYGAALPPLTASYSGFVNGDTEAGLDTPVSLSTAASASSAVGTYPIVAGGAADPNYSITHAEGTLTILPAATVGELGILPNPASPATAVNLTFSLQPVAPGGGVPTGAVRFKLNDAEAGTAALVGGSASLVRTDLPFGTYAVTAEYAGDGNFLGTTNTLATDLIVNTSPTAAPDAITRSATNGTKISVESLLANDSPGDGGDTLSLTSVAATSANGASLTRSNGWIYYTPAVGQSTNTDSFTYVVTDSLGATALGTVTVNPPLPDVPAMNLTIRDLGDGTLLLRFDGIPNATYSINQATRLAPPDWQTLATTNADAFGVFSLVVPKTPPAQFYRSVYR